MTYCQTLANGTSRVYLVRNPFSLAVWSDVFSDSLKPPHYCSISTFSIPRLLPSISFTILTSPYSFHWTLLELFNSTRTALLVLRSRDRFPVVSQGDFFPWYPRQNQVPWGRLSLWKWVPGNSPGIKAAGVYGWRPNSLVVPKVKIIQGLNLPGTPRANSACRGRPLLLQFKVTSTLIHFCRVGSSQN